jgi:hypothetical protein
MGIFDARRLESGEYTITAAKPGHTSGSATVDVEEGGLESVSLNIVPLPGAITGRVVDTASGKPVAGAVTYLDTSRVDRMTRTDAKGGFEITNVPAGSYTVCVEAEGFGSQTRLVEIMPGKEVTLDLLLIPINDYQLTNAGDL